MENCLAADPDDPFRGHEGPLVLERGPAKGPLFDAFFAAVQEAGLSADRRRERLSPGGLRGLRPQRAPGAAAVGRARVPAPGDEAPEPEGEDARAHHPDPVRGRARGGRGVHARRAHADRHGRRGAAVRGRDQLAAAAPALGRGRRRRASLARRRRGAGPAGRRREPAGPPRGLRAALGHPAGVDGALLRHAQAADGRARVAGEQVRPRRHQPLRGGRLRAQQRRGRPTRT